MVWTCDPRHVDRLNKEYCRDDTQIQSAPQLRNHTRTVSVEIPLQAHELRWLATGWS